MCVCMCVSAHNASGACVRPILVNVIRQNRMHHASTYCIRIARHIIEMCIRCVGRRCTLRECGAYWFNVLCTCVIDVMCLFLQLLCLDTVAYWYASLYRRCLACGLLVFFFVFCFCCLLVYFVVRNRHVTQSIWFAHAMPS